MELNFVLEIHFFIFSQHLLIKNMAYFLEALFACLRYANLFTAWSVMEITSIVRLAVNTRLVATKLYYGDYGETVVFD